MTNHCQQLTITLVMILVIEYTSLWSLSAHVLLCNSSDHLNTIGDADSRWWTSMSSFDTDRGNEN